MLVELLAMSQLRYIIRVVNQEFSLEEGPWVFPFPCLSLQTLKFYNRKHSIHSLVT